MAEREKNVLQEKLATLHMEEEACCKLQQKIQQLEDKISETQLHLDKENAKYHSACRQQEVSVTTNAGLFVVFQLDAMNVSATPRLSVMHPVNAGEAEVFVKESGRSRRGV